MTANQDHGAKALERLVAESVASRLWQRDPTLWPEPSPGGDPTEHTLGWLDLPARLPILAEDFSGLAARLVADGFTDAVVLGMGGSSMTPLTLSHTFETGLPPDSSDQAGNREAGRPTNHLGGLRLHALDTVNPGTLANLTQSLDLARTLFFVSSKSGTTVEPLSLEAHFRAALSDVSPGVSPGSGSGPDSQPGRRNFVALTDPGTPLSERARAGEFGTWMATPEDVGGRFSALSAFGMMPAAAAGIDVSRFSESVALMAGRCREDTDANPGLQLGAFLAENALEGRDKVTIITPPELSTLGMWVEQLLAESTGKDGKGLVPVAGEPPLGTGSYGDDRQFVVVNTTGEDSQLRRTVEKLKDGGHPVLVIEVPFADKYTIAGEFFRWQFATAAASSLMDIYPFDQPDVESAKVKARELLSDLNPSMDSVPLTSALEELGGVKPPSYVALTAFLPESAGLTSAFSALRAAISGATGTATTFGYGPRYLHSIGQLYKGGPRNAVVLGFVSGIYDDLAVPGASYTFGQLSAAQAGG
ncbi:MAG: phosphoheptose isomerase, partial [Dehalococcoidia bacterium]|nr:phosphoheptose isomerase [Dehalococcoidia bacterium]